MERNVTKPSRGGACRNSRTHARTPERTHAHTHDGTVVAHTWPVRNWKRGRSTRMYLRISWVSRIKSRDGAGGCETHNELVGTLGVRRCEGVVGREEHAKCDRVLQSAPCRDRDRQRRGCDAVGGWIRAERGPGVPCEYPVHAGAEVPAWHERNGRSLRCLLFVGCFRSDADCHLADVGGGSRAKVSVDPSRAARSEAPTSIAPEMVPRMAMYSTPHPHYV